MASSKRHRLYLVAGSQRSFGEVVAVLQEVLMFNKYQAEQCAVLAANVGRVELKSGSRAKMAFARDVLEEVGIRAEVVYG
jgi:hypothetical protein